MNATHTHAKTERASSSSDDADDLSPRRRVSQADITLCQAVFGVSPDTAAPSGDSVDRDVVAAEGVARDGSRLGRWIGAYRRSRPQDPMLASISRSGDRGAIVHPWSPAALSMSLADYCDGLSLRIRRLPEAGWVQQVSRQVRQQVERAQARFMGPWVQ